jgi:hypothetical protein
VNLGLPLNFGQNSVPLQKRVIRLVMDPQSYIKKHSLDLYLIVNYVLQDSLSLVQTIKPDNPKRYLYQYFENVKSGKHILNRGFNYLTLTKWNRDNFILHLKKTLPKGETI